MSRKQDDRQTALEYGHQHAAKPATLNEHEYDSLLRGPWAPRPSVYRKRSAWRRLADFLLRRT